MYSQKFIYLINIRNIILYSVFKLKIMLINKHDVIIAAQQNI